MDGKTMIKVNELSKAVMWEMEQKEDMGKIVNERVLFVKRTAEGIVIPYGNNIYYTRKENIRKLLTGEYKFVPLSVFKKGVGRVETEAAIFMRATGKGVYFFTPDNSKIVFASKGQMEELVEDRRDYITFTIKEKRENGNK